MTSRDMESLDIGSSCAAVDESTPLGSKVYLRGSQSSGLGSLVGFASQGRRKVAEVLWDRNESGAKKEAVAFSQLYVR